VDFAFAVHSGVGLRTLGARVNGRMVTLDHKLENRDVVEILTRRESAPNRDWLSFVRTTQAKNRIRAWFRAASREANIATGRAALEAELKAWGVKRLEDLPARQLAEGLDGLHMRSADDMLAAIGEGAVSAGQAIRKLVPDAARPPSLPVVKRTEATGRIIMDGGPTVPYTLAACCKPVFPQPVVGYITRGSGVTVHLVGCRNIPGDSERYADCHWETQTEMTDKLVCKLEVLAVNRIGLLADITGLVSRNDLSIGTITSRNEGPDGMRAVVEFILEVPDLFVLADIMKKLEKLPGVTAVKRV
jgi:guanosine-3',5'-bis(diphosphate) 3'-pyrophosphohydrolase